MIVLRKHLRNRWFICALILLIGLSSNLITDCDQESLDAASASQICFQVAQPNSCGDQPCNDVADTHGHAHCVCPCHVVGAFADDTSLDLPVSVGLLTPSSAARPDAIYLPHDLRPPIPA